MVVRKTLVLVAAMATVAVLFTGIASAHNVSKGDAKFVQANQGAATGPFMYLGAKHMVTGYDHLLFLVGVIFFLYKLKDVVQYVSLFTANKRWGLDYADGFREERIRWWKERLNPPYDCFPGDKRGWEAAHYGPAELTPLGRKLLGLDPW